MFLVKKYAVLAENLDFDILRQKFDFAVSAENFRKLILWFIFKFCINDVKQNKLAKT